MNHLDNSNPILAWDNTLHDNTATHVIQGVMGDAKVGLLLKEVLDLLNPLLRRMPCL